MAFTQVAITGTVTLSNATPASGASVNFTLNAPITDGTQIVTPEELTVRCASDGTFTITLNANDDTTTLPLGTYYEVSIVYGTQTLDSFNVIVPHADAPTVNLFTLAPLVNPQIAVPYVSQIVAGTNVTVSPAGGTGIVTVSASGSGGGSTLTPTGLKSSGTYAAVVGDEVLVDLSTANVTITLPTAPVDKSQVGWKIVKFAAGHTLTINTGGSDVFEVAGGATSNTGQILFQAKIYQYQHSTGIWIAESGDNSLTQLDARYNPVVQGAAATNLGATQTVDFQSRAQDIWLVGTLSANLTVTAANRAAGCRSLLIVTQPLSGGPYTLSVTDGVTPQLISGLNTAAGSPSVIEITCPDTATIDAVVPGNSGVTPSAQIFTSGGTYTIPAGATMLEIIAVGAGAGGGGGGSNAAAAANAGGGGGAAGASAQQVVAVGSNTSLTVTVGAGGGGGGGGAAGGAVGTRGTVGASTTVAGTGISVAAPGGSGGAPGPASANTAAAGGVKGAAASSTGVFSTTNAALPGCGGANSANGVVAGTGGPPDSYAGGGGGGTSSTTTNGGSGGTAGSLTAGGAEGSGTTGTANGGAGANAAANTGAGGGGGGGAPSGGAGGTGGTGGSGYAIIKVIG